MYAFLTGKYIVKTPAYVWLDVNGVGYEVYISLHTYSQIQDLQQGRLLTYLQVKEDAHTLFGFFDDDERTLFIHLLSVSGVGASTARMMLSSMKPDEIRHAIVTENELLLGRIKGIGPKSAKRLILELKDKLLKLKPSDNIQS
ncbi:MAG: Holliday junction branch migration protein RuvA, partial [Chitinophagaceae bacterium]|nr:Holliday junction branch migration protein RuvA [Chitinophagaceae bacterium]